MDDLKHKFLGFINKQGQHLRSPPSTPTSDDGSGKIPPEDRVPVTRESLSKGKRHREPDPLADQDILESIEEVYFSDENFDACDHELKKLPETLDCETIEHEYLKLSKQQVVVSKQVLQLILQKQSMCNEEFSRILELQQQLQDALDVCRAGRSGLGLATRHFTTASLGILANTRKKQLLKGLLHSLQTIKTLQRTEERLQELLGEGDYPGAIALLLECQGAAATYRHFSCVAALSAKLQDTLVMAEEQLDQALSKVCGGFSVTHYAKVQAAYRLLGKAQVAIDQLHMHFASAVHNKAFTVVHGYVELCAGEARHKQFRQLCQSVTPESYIPCLMDLCRALWEIVRSYHQVVAWHQRHDKEIPVEESTATGDGGDLEASITRRYVHQKLESGLVRVWHDVQAHVSPFLLGCDMARHSLDGFLQVLQVVHRLMEVGEEFCGSHSEELQGSIRQQSLAYFHTYHRARLDELRVFLENEGWEVCPVKASFSLAQLHEFRSLRHVLKSTPRSPDDSSGHSHDGSSVAGGYLQRYADGGSPFDLGPEEPAEEDILAHVGDEPSGYFSDESGDEDVPDDLKRDLAVENAGVGEGTLRSSGRRKDAPRAPLLTNTALSLLRHLGRYLQMCRLLRPIAADVVQGMSQLLDYYLYTVHQFFAADQPIPNHSLYSLRLQAALKRIEGTLVAPAGLPEDISQDERVVAPQMSPCVDLTQLETLHGLAERVVAVESLVFLAQQLESLRPCIERLAGPGSVLPLGQLAVDLRRPVYACVAARVVDVDTTLYYMSRVNWEVKDVMSQHSPYVDHLVRDLQIFSMRLEEVSTRVPLTQEVLNVLWDCVVQLTCSTFVEGFARAKRCSNGGRALMQLDFTQFLSKLERLTTLRPLPGRELVEAYVKAFYMPESVLENWLREHCEYSNKQLLALVSCACQNNKKTRQRLTTMLEDMERVGR